jgi:hypothetical protein
MAPIEITRAAGTSIFSNERSFSTLGASLLGRLQTNVLFAFLSGCVAASIFAPQYTQKLTLSSSTTVHFGQVAAAVRADAAEPSIIAPQFKQKHMPGSVRCPHTGQSDSKITALSTISALV